MGRRSDIDWEKIERLFRVGQLSVRDIAKQCGVQPSSITRRAERDGWGRDHTAEVRRETQAALLKATGNATAKATPPTQADLDAAVQTNVQVVTTHRQDISTTRTIVDLLLGQLQGAVGNRDALETIIEEATADADDPEASKTSHERAHKRRAQLMKAVSLPVHATTVKDLTLALAKLIPLQRQAFNIDARADEPPAADDAPAPSLTALEDFERRLVELKRVAAPAP